MSIVIHKYNDSILNSFNLCTGRDCPRASSEQGLSCDQQARRAEARLNLVGKTATTKQNGENIAHHWR
jgi:hypothetical protein